MPPEASFVFVDVGADGTVQSRLGYTLLEEHRGQLESKLCSKGWAGPLCSAADFGTDEDAMSSLRSALIPLNFCEDRLGLESGSIRLVIVKSEGIHALSANLPGAFRYILVSQGTLPLLENLAGWIEAPPAEA